MSVAAVLPAVADLVVRAEDKTPKDNDVVAGGWGALVFVLLILAVVVLAFSFVKQLRKAQAAKDAGVFGDVGTPSDTGATGATGDTDTTHITDTAHNATDEPENHSAS